VMVQDATLAAPLSALKLATLVIPAGTSAITPGNIASLGTIAKVPALADPSYGYVDKKTVDTDTSTPIAAKRFDKIGIGTGHVMGTNIMAQTISANFTLPNSQWTDVPFNNSAPALGINYAVVSIHDDDNLYHNPGGPLNGWVPEVAGWYRISAAFTFSTGGGASVGRRGVRAIGETGRVIAADIRDASEVQNDHPVCMSQPFYWRFANDASQPIKIQLWQGSGANMTIVTPDQGHPQVAVFERLA